MGISSTLWPRQPQLSIFISHNQQLRKNKDLLSRREKGSKVEVWKFCWCSPLKVAFHRSTSAWSRSVFLQTRWCCCVLQISFAWTVGCFNATCKLELLPNSLTLFFKRGHVIESQSLPSQAQLNEQKKKQYQLEICWHHQNKVKWNELNSDTLQKQAN